MTALTPEQMLERLRACIAEAGYDPRAFILNMSTPGHLLYDAYIPIPLFVRWRAMVLASACSWCWPCAKEHYEQGRQGGNATIPCGHPVDPFVREDAEVS